ncbi:MAG: hypothetical protein ACFFAX_16260 [Promethearchaeota archaeon]
MRLTRKIAIGYAVVGFSYFLLWHFMLSSTDKANLVLQALFYVALPAVLVCPYLIVEAVDEAIRRRRE